MSDLLPHIHGDEGEGATHYACPEMIKKHGMKVVCCGCRKHDCKKPPQAQVLSKTQEKLPRKKTEGVVTTEQEQDWEKIKTIDSFKNITDVQWLGIEACVASQLQQARRERDSQLRKEIALLPISMGYVRGSPAPVYMIERDKVLSLFPDTSKEEKG